MSDTTADSPTSVSVPSTTQMVPRPPRPIWLPDTQGFLAVAIISIIAIIAFILLGSSVKFDDKVAGAFMTLLGVLTACLKDVYSYFFGSSKGEEKKGDVISTIAQAPVPPPVVAPALPPTPDALGAAMLANGEKTFFQTLPDDESKKKFLSMTTTERATAIGKGSV